MSIKRYTVTKNWPAAAHEHNMHGEALKLVNSNVRDVDTVYLAVTDDENTPPTVNPSTCPSIKPGGRETVYIDPSQYLWMIAPHLPSGSIEIEFTFVVGL